ncbi:MAG: class I SAM-dependent methyltransferase [Kiritimatiellia bacterium]
MISSHSRFDFGTLAAGYDAWYKTADGRMHDAAQKEAVASLLPVPSAGSRPALLDVGCGTGHWSVFFAEHGFEVTGVDISPEMISVAQGRHAPHCSFAVADAMKLPFQDGEFEVASAMAALEFVSDARRACAEMIRCLKPGGCLLVGALNRLAVLNRKRISSGSGLYSSARMFTQAELRGLLSAFGRVSIRLTAEKKPGAFIVATVKKK